MQGSSFGVDLWRIVFGERQPPLLVPIGVVRAGRCNQAKQTYRSSERGALAGTKIWISVHAVARYSTSEGFPSYQSSWTTAIGKLTVRDFISRPSALGVTGYSDRWPEEPTQAMRSPGSCGAPLRETAPRADEPCSRGPRCNCSEGAQVSRDNVRWRHNRFSMAARLGQQKAPVR